jgi:hypothetical protein
MAATLTTKQSLRLHIHPPFQSCARTVPVRARYVPSMYVIRMRSLSPGKARCIIRNPLHTASLLAPGSVSREAPMIPRIHKFGRISRGREKD